MESAAWSMRRTKTNNKHDRTFVSEGASPQHPTARDLVHSLKGEEEKVLLSVLLLLWRIVLMQQPTEGRIVVTECPGMVIPCVLCFLRFF